MSRKIYMNVAEGDECRIAVMEDGKLYEFFVDRPSQLKHVGNIYKGVINNTEPGIQAAFVDIGLERNGFLHVSDVDYAYQNTTDVKQLYSKTIRIKEPTAEDAPFHEREERDVEEADDFVGDGSHPGESANGAAEADFLEKLEEEQPGHHVTDSPLAVAPPDKKSEPQAPAPEAGAETAGDAEARTQPVGATPVDAKPPEERRRRRPRRRRRKPAADGSAQLAVKPDQPAGGEKPAQTQPTEAAGTPAPAKPAAEKPATEAPAKPAAEKPAEPAKSQAASAEQKPAGAEAASSDKRRRRRTPKLRGGRLPKRVTDEIPKGQAEPGKAPAAEPKPPAPAKTEAADNPPRKDIDGQSGGDGGPIPGPNYRYHRGPQPKIQNLLKRGQEVVVQVTKASQGGKGPGLNTFVSLPGRYMVLTPNSDRGGVSRKIEDGAARTELRKMLNRLPVPEGMGIIIRTAAINRSFEELQRDLNYLVRVWSVISDRIHDSDAPALLYTDSDPAIRTVRDYFTTDTTEIIVDDKTVFERVLAFFDQLMPSFRDRVKLYEGEAPLFFHTGLENQLDHIFDKKVNLKSGGYLFVEQTEALISIDVNSGKFTSAGDAEKTAYQTNLEAIPEICRQLRLRDLAGIVCCDLIDMSTAKHRSDIEHALRRELRRDRARTKVAKMSPFGVIEMTRQRVRPSIKNYTYVSCPTCAGFGMVRSAETMCLSLIRRLKLALIEDRVAELAVQVHPHVLSHLHSEFRDDINDLEDATGKRIVFEYAKDLVLGQTRFFYVNDRGGRVLYDMDQRINSFVSTNAPKAKTNVPLPLNTSGAASPAVAEAEKDNKARRRKRGGRRQRERDQERLQREARIKSDESKAVTFGDKLPEAKVEMVKEDPPKAAGATGEGKRRRGRRGGRKAREREAAKTGSAQTGEAAGKAEASKTKSASRDRKTTTAAKPAGQSATTKAKSAPKKTATGSKPAARTTTAKKPATARTATKTAARSPAKKPATKTVTKTATKTAKKAPAKTAARSAAKKATTKPAAKAAAKKPAAKKAPAKKVTAAKKPAAKKPAAKKPAVKKSATARKKSPPTKKK